MAITKLTRTEKLRLAVETLEMCREMDAIACHAMRLGISREEYVVSVIASWNEMAAKAVQAVDLAEKNMEPELIPVPVKSTGKVNN